MNLAEATQAVASGSLQEDRDSFSVCVLRIPVLSASALLVALELCPVSTAFWQRNNTLVSQEEQILLFYK